METISVQRATNVIADWYVASLPAKDPAKPHLDAHNAQHREVEMGRVSYNLQAGLFNLATIGLVTTVALAVIGTITLQMGFVLAGLFLLIRHDIRNTLAEYALSAEESQRKKGEFAMVKQFDAVFQMPEMIEGVLRNLGFLDGTNPEIEQWKPIAVEAFGHNALMSFLPNGPIVTKEQYGYAQDQSEIDGEVRSRNQY